MSSRSARPRRIPPLFLAVSLLGGMALLADLMKSEAATAWLASLPPSEARSDCLLRQIAGWAKEEPGKAADFALSLPAGTERDYAVLNTALSWNRQDPAAARQWLDSLPDSPAKTHALQELGISTPKP